MKNIIILLLVFATTNSFAQTTTDTTLRVVYGYADDMKMPQGKIAYFLNGHFMVTEPSLVNLSLVENIHGVSSDTTINNVIYNYQFFLTTKSYYYYNPKPISLTDLKNRFTNLKDKPVIFMYDGEILKCDYDNFMVDENNLLTIIVDKYQNSKESLDLGLIKLLTKSEENIKQRKLLAKYGKEVTMTNK